MHLSQVFNTGTQTAHICLDQAEGKELCLLAATFNLCAHLNTYWNQNQQGSTIPEDRILFKAVELSGFAQWSSLAVPDCKFSSVVQWVEQKDAAAL